MATKNTRNARLLISSTLAAPYTIISKAHGVTLNLTTDFSEDTAYGDVFKSYVPGLQDFKATLNQWYETAQSVLESASKNRTSYYFLLYPDYNDSTNYYRGQCYFGLDEFNLAMGNTADMTFTMVIANADVAIVRAGTAL